MPSFFVSINVGASYSRGQKRLPFFSDPDVVKAIGVNYAIAIVGSVSTINAPLKRNEGEP